MTIKEKVKELWRLCFDDTEEFIELYFRLRYSNKINITIQSGDEIISALQMISYPMTFYGNQINTSYISGACTHPDYRGKGIMRELLTQSFIQMTRKGIPVSTLIPAEPWLFDYYKRMGYAPVFYYSDIRLKPEEIQASGDIQVKEINSLDKVSYSYFNRKMHERQCCVQHDEGDSVAIQEDLTLSDGKIYIAHENNTITGIAFVEPKGSILQVKEVFSENDAIKNALLGKASNDFKPEMISVIAPSNPGIKGCSLGMTRIIYAKGVLQLYATANPEKELSIELTDKQLSLNNGYYYIVNGKCMTTRKRIPGSHLELNISELAELIFAPEQPYMSLMMN